jgi:acyl-CoA synthetase (AMP-forming)/AMP-acid ligase II
MFEAQVQIIRRQYGLQPGEIEMPAFPLFALFNVALGTTSAIPPIDPTRPAACDPAAVVRFMQDQHVTSTFGSPAIWEKVTRYCLEQGIRLPELRRVLMAGAPVPTVIHERFEQILAPGATTHTPYGATEALPIVSATGREVLDAMRLRNDPMAGTCVGSPVQEVTLRIIPIVDAPIAEWNEQACLPPYDVGEIVVKGPVVTKEYVNRPESTALAKIREGDAIWHRMGDLGYQDDAGRVWFYGRKSQRVQLADRCLYTEPCELIFNQHPQVRRSALVGIRKPGAAFPIPAMIIEPQREAWPATAAEREGLANELRELGAHYPMTAQIQTILFHPAFPVDIRHNAKIFREQLAVWAERQSQSFP